MYHSAQRAELVKIRIRETPILSTDADSRTDNNFGEAALVALGEGGRGVEGGGRVGAGGGVTNERPGSDHAF